jgi:hypothetical protein
MFRKYSTIDYPPRHIMDNLSWKTGMGTRGTPYGAAGCRWQYLLRHAAARYSIPERGRADGTGTLRRCQNL